VLEPLSEGYQKINLEVLSEGYVKIPDEEVLEPAKTLAAKFKDESVPPPLEL
jgi:hypothetical protein